MTNNFTKKTSSHHQNHHFNQNYNHPSSFSSSLLEKIYQSFDEDDDHHENCDALFLKKSRMMNKSNSCYMERNNMNNGFVFDGDKINNLRRNSMVEVTRGEKFNSSSSSSTSSSDSSYGIGGFSSSESESVFMSSKSKTKVKNLTLKPIRTSFNNSPEFHRKSYSDEFPAKKKSTNKEGNLQKRALKLYGDLKKVKQPISPGGKLASFLNSLFNSTASKKPKISSSSAMMTSSSSLSASVPSTASSYSRSCLSKTPSSAGRFERRSVRFCPVNTIIAATEECNVVGGNENEELKVKIMEKHRRVEEVAKELLKNYHGRKYQNNNSNVNIINKSININNNKIRRFEDEDEEDDDVSCCSSDLFELENLLDIGVDRRYCQELPVYETTHVDTNRAIANGFML